MVKTGGRKWRRWREDAEWAGEGSREDGRATVFNAIVIAREVRFVAVYRRKKLVCVGYIGWICQRYTAYLR